jgi:hypothetical protein
MPKVLTPGHKYVANNFENPENGQTIQFIEKMSVVEMRLAGIFPKNDEAYPNNLDEIVTVNDGTTNEELLLVLIDRIKFLNGKFPCKENACAITHMEEALHWLYARTDARIKQGVEGVNKPHSDIAMSTEDDGFIGTRPDKGRP